MITISVFDLCVITFALCGLLVLLGAQAGRAAAWREGCWYIASLDPGYDPGPPPSPDRRPPLKSADPNPDTRKPVVVDQVTGANGRSSKVVGRNFEKGPKHDARSDSEPRG